MKTCFKCNRRLPLGEFYRHPEMDDGHLGKCKTCTKIDVRQNYADKREKYLAYEQSRRGTATARVERSKARHPDRNKARRLTQAAVAGGRLTKQPCRNCGNPKVEGHHEDYTKPLEVVWLCRRHHADHHFGSITSLRTA